MEELVRYILNLKEYEVSRFGARLDQVTSKLKLLSLSAVTLHL